MKDEEVEEVLIKLEGLRDDVENLIDTIAERHYQHNDYFISKNKSIEIIKDCHDRLILHFFRPR